MNNPTQVYILTTEFKTNMTLPLTSKIPQTVSGIFSFRKMQTLSAELTTTAIVLTVLPDEKLLAEELERSRIELEARRLARSRSEGDV